MTEKQRDCIDWICETLGVKYYGKDTKQDAWTFINKFIDRAKEVCNESSFYGAWGMCLLVGGRLGRSNK